MAGDEPEYVNNLHLNDQPQTTNETKEKNPTHPTFRLMKHTRQHFAFLFKSIHNLYLNLLGYDYQLK